MLDRLPDNYFTFRDYQKWEGDERYELIDGEPDISVICDEKKLDDAGCRGAPDVIIEVISPATAARDRILKRDLYQSSRVGEYWLIDPERRSLRIYRREPGSASFEKPLESRAAGKTRLKTLGVVVDFGRLFFE